MNHVAGGNASPLATIAPVRYVRRGLSDAWQCADQTVPRTSTPEVGVIDVPAPDGDGPPVVPSAARRLGPVVLVHAHGHVAVDPDAVVRGRLPSRPSEVVRALPATPPAAM